MKQFLDKVFQCMRKSLMIFLLTSYARALYDGFSDKSFLLGTLQA